MRDIRFVSFKDLKINSVVVCRKPETGEKMTGIISDLLPRSHDFGEDLIEISWDTGVWHCLPARFYLNVEVDVP
jgi:hypothetical protein